MAGRMAAAIIAAILLSAYLAEADGGRVVARLIMADGARITLDMESRAACETFTAAIASYVESADCETV